MEEQPHFGPHHPRRPDRPATMSFVYFGVAFTLCVAVTMFALMFARPHLEGAPRWVLAACMLAPPALGVVYGARVAVLGGRHNLRIGAALKRGLGFRNR